MITDRAFVESILPDELKKLYMEAEGEQQPPQEASTMPIPTDATGEVPQAAAPAPPAEDAPETPDSADDAVPSGPKAPQDYEQQAVEEIKDAKSLINGIIGELEATPLSTPEEYKALATDLDLAKMKIEWASKILDMISKMVGKKEKIKKDITPVEAPAPPAPPSMRQA